MKIVITQLPRWGYFKYFLLGFYELQDKESLKIKFRSNICVNLATKTNNYFLLRVIRKIYSKFKVSNLYNLKGYIELDDGIKKLFVIDSADAPFLFNCDDLEEADVYFKMQCPKVLNNKGFELAPNIIIPWSDHKKIKNSNARKLCYNFEKNKYKIKPLMIGPRNLAEGISIRD